MLAREVKRLLFGWALLAGCDEGLDGRLRSCRAFCAKLELCDDETDLFGCEQKCAYERVKSEAYLDARASCTDELSCNAFAGETSTMGEDYCDGNSGLCRLNRCTANKLARQKLTTDEQSYCTSVVTKLNACDRTLPVIELEMHCFDLLPTLSAEYQQETLVCIETTCDQVVSCLRRLADRYNTGLSVYARPIVPS